jgi:signal transduction histidine kinase
VAEHRLPAAVQNLLTDPEPAPENLRKRLAVAPVPVFTREELGQVARAFDAVHGEAVRLAGEQAMLRENVNAMFVNLSQRSQDLVERQLSVLDRMEAGEQDPDTLAGLFELDHLATRMRRNSENLLVLSGHDAIREDAGPVAADEIVGAALSEVEYYQRIELGPAPQVAVRGEAVNDLVHVISELLENATRYSGEQTVVTVSSAETHDGDWQIEIIDRGAGMPQAEIDRTNARLAHPPDVDVEVSRRMGLFVVATLATRHRIDVSLSSGQDGGLIATVLVPSALIVELPPMPGPPPPAEPAAAPEPELLAPLAPLTPPEPEPEPEPEELTPPSIEAGPLRRAPVVARDHSPQWPTADDDSHLDLDAPTERMPAYRDVLSRWFDAAAEAPPTPPRPVTETQAPPPEPEPAPHARHALATPPPPPEPAPEPAHSPDDEDTEPQLTPVKPAAAHEVPEPDYQWPTPAELEQEDGAEDTWPFMHPADSSASPAEVPQQRPILSLSPEAVRERMTSLQGGFRRGRHARGEDTGESVNG